VIIEAICAIAAAYQLFAIIACLRFRNSRQGPFRKMGATGQPVSVLKPVQGLDPALRAAIESHSNLHGEYEFLCGVRSLDDPAVALLREFPRARVIECTTETPNGKVGVMMDLVRAARYAVLVINDADIRVEPDYLERVTAPLADPRIGLVTCLYRAEGSTFAARTKWKMVSARFSTRSCMPSTFSGSQRLSITLSSTASVWGSGREGSSPSAAR